MRAQCATARPVSRVGAVSVVSELAQAPDATYGPFVCAAAALYVGWVFFQGAREVEALSAELAGKGFDVSAINKLKELRFLKRAVEGGDKGEIQESLDKIWFSRAKTIAATGDLMQVKRMTAYWKTRGVKVERLSDLDDLQAWMIAKYNRKS